MAKNSKADRVVKAVLIDPFKHDLIDVTIHHPDDPQPEIAKLLDCTYLDCIWIEGLIPAHAIWLDDEGLLREPFVYPKFRCHGANRFEPIAGYGLITALDQEEQIIPASLRETFGLLIWFEPWEQRIDPDRVIQQLMRIYL